MNNDKLMIFGKKVTK